MRMRWWIKWKSCKNHSHLRLTCDVCNHQLTDNCIVRDNLISCFRDPKIGYCTARVTEVNVGFILWEC